MWSAHFIIEKWRKQEDHLPIMSLRRRKQGNCQGLSKDRNHALVLFYFTRHAVCVYDVATIEGRPMPRVSTVPRNEPSADQKKSMESI